MFLKYSAVPYSAITCDIDDEMANFLFPSFLWIHLVSRENFIPSSFQQIETHSNNNNNNKRSEERKWCWVMWSVMKYLRKNIGGPAHRQTVIPIQVPERSDNKTTHRFRYFQGKCKLLWIFDFIIIFSIEKESACNLCVCRECWFGRPSKLYLKHFGLIKKKCVQQHRRNDGMKDGTKSRKIEEKKEKNRKRNWHDEKVGRLVANVNCRWKCLPV